MARQSSDKLLFEVQLVPPSASNIQTVSQAINKVSNAKQKNTKATQQSIKADKQQKSLYDKLKTDIRELETATKQAENANRFGNQTKEKSIKVTQAQLVQLEKLQKEIKQANLSRKQQAKLMNLVETKRKTMNRSMGRVREGWRGLAKANRHGNRMLMQSGRILQDLPFGFMGISNNIQELVMSWGRASNQGKSFTQVLSGMGKSLMGTGGLIFLLGSALPFAMTVATNGFMGFRNMMGESKKETDELKGNLGDLVNSITELRAIQGEDPLGIQDVESRIRGVRSILSSLDHIVEKQDKIKDLGNQSRVMYGAQETEISSQQEQLQKVVEQEAERFGLTVEQFNKLKDQEASLENQLETLVKLGRIEPAQAFEIQEFDKANELIKRFNEGIREVGDERTVKALEDQRDRIMRARREWQRMAEMGDKSVMPFLTASGKVLDDINDTLDKIPEKPFVELDESLRKATEVEIPDLDLSFDEADLGQFDPIDHDKWLKRRDKFFSQLSERVFKIRKELSGDLVALQISTERQINEVMKRARELNLENSEEVQEAITAIRRREAHKRHDLELERERQLRDAKFGIWSQTQSFIEAVNSNILGNSKMVALISLAVEKGLQIAKVASKTSEKVSDLQQMAGVAGAKASMETAKATSAIASGNLVKAGLHSTASGKFRQAQASATAQAGKTASIGAKTIALIAGQTLAQSAGILTGGGSGGSGGGSGGGGASGGVVQADEGFNEFDVDDDFGEAGEMRDGRITGSLMDALKKTVSRDIVIRMEGELDPRLLSIKAETGRRTRESNAVVIQSDR